MSEEPDDVVWLRDLDGTGSMHPCTPHCEGAIRYFRETCGGPISNTPTIYGLRLYARDTPIGVFGRAFEVCFADRVELECFYDRIPADLEVVDHMEYPTHTCAEALDAAAEHLAEVYKEFEQ